MSPNVGAVAVDSLAAFSFCSLSIAMKSEFLTDAMNQEHTEIFL